uniref:Cation efflux protein transmembrane domain-containing protein n=1 Tax=Apteryx owenii TaxID=8824 RepID=A0A8B9PPX1_APTOW
MGRYSGKTCRLIFMLVLTVGFFVAELVSGYIGNSIALVSDSFNMLSDLISLCVGLSTGRIARRSRRGPRATYGYSRAEAVGALSNAVFLAALCFTIFVEAVLRLARPERIDDAELVLIVGALGLAVNLVGVTRTLLGHYSSSGTKNVLLPRPSLVSLCYLECKDICTDRKSCMQRSSPLRVVQAHKKISDQIWNNFESEG